MLSSLEESSLVPLDASTAAQQATHMPETMTTATSGVDECEDTCVSGQDLAAVGGADEATFQWAMSVSIILLPCMPCSVCTCFSYNNLHVHHGQVSCVSFLASSVGCLPVWHQVKCRA